jgi:hypothetical protein
MDLASGTSFAGHRVEGVVGRGGMGVVYRATHLALDRIVALKVIREDFAEDEEFRERFRREAKLAASLEHPNVLPVMDAGEEGGVLYITMRFVAGTDLGGLIRDQGPVPPERVATIAREVGGALDAAHESGLIHRDVKPANILLDGRGGDGRSYLTDFGLTRRQASGAALTGTGQMVGTLNYVAPEQIEGRDVDHRVDVYSLACVLFEALAGKPPYARDSEVATMYAHLQEPPPDLAEIRPATPGAVSDALLRGMAKDREERFGSAGELGRAVAAGMAPTAVSRDDPPAKAATGPSGGATPATVPAAREEPDERARRPTGGGARPRVRLAWIAAGLAAAAIVAVGVIALAGGGEDSGESAAGTGEPTDVVEDLDTLTVRPSGTKASLAVVTDPDDKVAVVLYVKDEASGDNIEVARAVAPGAAPGPGTTIEADQRGKAYERDGGQGLLVIGEDYARYFGWNIDSEIVEFY